MAGHELDRFLDAAHICRELQGHDEPCLGRFAPPLAAADAEPKRSGGELLHLKPR